MQDRRFIEETFPVKEISAESARDKSIRHGNISTLHIWWARKPMASSRATNYAALILTPSDRDEWSRTREFIISFSKRENSLDRHMIERAKRDILETNGGNPPRVLDPFAGGGTIPLEALRLGCEVYSSDYNPVAVLIQKCTLEYPQKYGNAPKGKHEWTGLKGSSSRNPLLEDVGKWGAWVLEETKKELGKYYPNESNSSVPVGYIWARTIPCQNPACGGEIPLLRQFWIAKRPKKRVSLYPHIEGKAIKFGIVGDGYEKMPVDFNPDNGTVSRAIVTCMVCGSVVESKIVRRLFQDGKARQQMVAVALRHPQEKGKTYRISTQEDLQIFREAEEHLENKLPALQQDWGINPVPDEFIHTPDGKEYEPGGLLYNFTPVLLYGMKTWGDLFNSRQKLALVTFTEKIRQAYENMLNENYEGEYAKAVVAFLGLCLDREAENSTLLCRWNPHAEKMQGTFGRQALPMVWDPFEANPFGGSVGDWLSIMNLISNAINASSFDSAPATVTQSSATSLPYPDNYFDAIITDPPYYDNVPYADLSDFFYVWLKRTLGHLYPDLFSTPSTPKTNEAIAELPLLRGMGKEKAGKIIRGIKTKDDFESMLKKSFQEIYRTLRHNGISVIVYAHKSTEGWETLINSLLDSGLIITSAWPIDTEMGTRLRARESAALASSIYIVARKMKRQPTGFYNEVKQELTRHLNAKLHSLWEEGIGGADFLISAIGSAIEIFGRYERVMDFEGNIVRANRLLDDVREIATDYAVRQILHDGFTGEISDLTRLYVLWRWEFGESRVRFDDARKLAQSCGIDLSQEWNRDGFIRKEKEFIRVLSPRERNHEKLAHSNELIDILHLALLHWEKGKRDDMAQVISDSGFGQSEAFYRVAQAISETLPNESKEKKLLDGFLTGRERIQREVRKKTMQTKLM